MEAANSAQMELKWSGIQEDGDPLNLTAKKDDDLVKLRVKEMDVGGNECAFTLAPVNHRLDVVGVLTACPGEQAAVSLVWPEWLGRKVGLYYLDEEGTHAESYLIKGEKERDYEPKWHKERVKRQTSGKL